MKAEDLTKTKILVREREIEGKLKDKEGKMENMKTKSEILDSTRTQTVPKQANTDVFSSIYIIIFHYCWQPVELLITSSLVTSG